MKKQSLLQELYENLSTLSSLSVFAWTSFLCLAYVVLLILENVLSWFPESLLLFPEMVCSFLFGFFPAMLQGVLSDLANYTANLDLGYRPLWMISEILPAFIYAAFFYRKAFRVKSMVAAAFLVSFCCECLIAPALCFFYDGLLPDWLQVFRQTACIFAGQCLLLPCAAWIQKKLKGKI